MAQSILDIIQKDHETVQSMFEDLSDTTEKAEKTRKEGLSKLKDEITPHMLGEEQVFYPRLKEQEEARETALEAIEEHRVAKSALSELMETQPSDETWHARLTVLQELIEHHIEEEEGEIFEQASELFDDKQLEEMGRQFEQAKEEAKSGAMA